MAQIRAVGENYPDLLSSNQFLALQKEIADENEDLAASKRIVNSNISQINQAIVTFPTSLVAGIKGDATGAIFIGRHTRKEEFE